MIIDYRLSFVQKSPTKSAKRLTFPSAFLCPSNSSRMFELQSTGSWAQVWLLGSFLVPAALSNQVNLKTAQALVKFCPQRLHKQHHFLA